MRILQLIQCPQRRGAEIFASQLAIELIKRGHQVDIAYLYERKVFQLKYDVNYISLGANRANRFRDFSAYRKLNQVIRDGKYDIVQANASDTLKYAVLSKLIYGWKSKLVFRNANKMSEFLHGFIHRQLNIFFLKKCDFIISVSEICRQDLFTFYKDAERKSKTITIGTYTFDDIPSSEQPGHHPVLIHIGGMVPEKNHIFLIDIFRKVIGEFKDAQLWLFGEGRMQKAIKEKIASLDLEKNVVLWGNRPDVISYLKRADVMVMPSRIEGLPGVIFESMSCKVPVVAAPVGGIPEVIEHGKTGFTPDQYSPEQYYRYINELLSNKEIHTEITENARKMVTNSFLMPRIAEKFEEAYAEVVKG